MATSPHWSHDLPSSSPWSPLAWQEVLIGCMTSSIIVAMVSTPLAIYFQMLSGVHLVCSSGCTTGHPHRDGCQHRHDSHQHLGLPGPLHGPSRVPPSLQRRHRAWCLQLADCADSTACGALHWSVVFSSRGSISWTCVEVCSQSVGDWCSKMVGYVRKSCVM